MDTQRLYELAQSAEDETLIREVVATLENYEYLKTKLPKCNCTDSTMYVEGICVKCRGLEVEGCAVFSWRW